MRYLVTGAAGFIGFHTAKRLLDSGHEVLGFDNINDYYDPSHKYARLEVLRTYQKYSFVRGNLEDVGAVSGCWEKFTPEIVIHLAAQAGVRYSIENPNAYINSNIIGFQTMIDLAKKFRPQNFVYASSSSVYGGNKTLPFSEEQNVSNPISLYAATKLANELVARTYGNLFSLPSTGLRFFTVYGPYARPDMALFKFTNLMQQGKPLPLYNSGKMVRDFTYIDDIVDGILACAAKPQISQVYNLGRGEPMNLMDAVQYLQDYLGLKAQFDLMPMQLGDVEATIADVSKARQDVGYDPKVSLKDGIKYFSDWYLTKFLRK